MRRSEVSSLPYQFSRAGHALHFSTEHRPRSALHYSSDVYTLHPLAKLEESARKEFAALWQRLGLTSSKLDGDYSKAVPGDPGVGLPDLEEQDAMLREMKAQNDALLDEMLNELAPPMET